MPDETPTPAAPLSATPNMDLMLNPSGSAYYKMKLKEGQGPHFVRKGEVRAGDEFVTDANHAKELFQTGAAEVIGSADAPDLTPAEAISRAAAVAEGNPNAYKPGVATDLDPKPKAAKK